MRVGGTAVVAPTVVGPAVEPPLVPAVAAAPREEPHPPPAPTSRRREPTEHRNRPAVHDPLSALLETLQAGADADQWVVADSDRIGEPARCG